MGLGGEEKSAEGTHGTSRLRATTEWARPRRAAPPNGLSLVPGDGARLYERAECAFRC